MERRYTCRYCQTEHTSKYELYDHIYNTSICSNSHNSRFWRRFNIRTRDEGYRERELSRTQTSTYVSCSRQVQNQEVSIEKHPTGDDVEAIDPNQSCVICMVNKCQITSTSCGHLCCCIGCSQQLYQSDGRCPQCRGEWKKLIRIFT